MGIVVPLVIAAVVVAISAAAAVFLAIIRAPTSRVSIKGRHVLITGGSSGIGLELAKLVASEGASKITLLARNIQSLEKAVQDVRSCGTSQVDYVSADVVNFEQVSKAIREACPVDVLVCSHGLSIPSSMDDASLEDLHKMVNINLLGTINVIKAALPGMKRDKPDYARSIALVSSQAGQTGMYGYAVYSATKAGLRLMGEGLSQEQMHQKIQISIIYPPDTNTPGFVEENKTKPEITKILSESSAPMEADDVARVTLRGIKAGMLNVPCNFDGVLLGIATAGMSPQTSALHAAVEIVFASLIRLIGLCVQYSWRVKLANWIKMQHCK